MERLKEKEPLLSIVMPVYGVEQLPIREETWSPTGEEVEAFNAKGLGY